MICIIWEIFVFGWCLLIIVIFVLFNNFVIVWVCIMLLMLGEIMIGLLRFVFWRILLISIGELKMLFIGILKKFCICFVWRL